MRGVLVFLAGGVRLGVSLPDVARLVVEGAIAPVPFGHSALAGVMRVKDVDDATVPVFDLHGLAPEATRPPTQRAGATVAVIPTARGPVGLRLDHLLGTASDYTAVDAADVAALHARLSPALQKTLAGAGRPETARVAVGDDPFFCFSPEAFIAAVGL
jgi:hypothetical protein